MSSISKDFYNYIEKLQGANPNAIHEASNKTPLYLALASTNNPEVIKILLKAGADISVGKEFTDDLEGEIKILIEKEKLKKGRMNVGFGLGKVFPTNVKSSIANFAAGPLNKSNKTRDPIFAINKKIAEKEAKKEEEIKFSPNNFGGVDGGHRRLPRKFTRRRKAKTKKTKKSKSRKH